MQEELERIKKKLKELEDRNFRLDMKETWSDNDFRLSHELHREIHMCKEIIKDLESKITKEEQIDGENH